MLAVFRRFFPVARGIPAPPLTTVMWGPCRDGHLPSRLRTVEADARPNSLVGFGSHGQRGEFLDHDHSSRATDRAHSGWSDRRRAVPGLPRLLRELGFGRWTGP